MIEAIHARAEHALLLAVTARPELAEIRGGWGYRPGMSQVVLEPLAAPAARELAEELLPGRAGEVADACRRGQPVLRRGDRAPPRIRARRGDPAHGARARGGAHRRAARRGEAGPAPGARRSAARSGPPRCPPTWRSRRVLRSLEDRGFVITRSPSQLPGPARAALRPRAHARRRLPLAAAGRAHARARRRRPLDRRPGRRPPRRVRRAARPSLRGGRRPPATTSCAPRRCARSSRRATPPAAGSRRRRRCASPTARRRWRPATASGSRCSSCGRARGTPRSRATRRSPPTSRRSTWRAGSATARRCRGCARSRRCCASATRARSSATPGMRRPPTSSTRGSPRSARTPRRSRPARCWSAARGAWPAGAASS